ncbi:radical SAM protein [Nocardioides sp. R-C-SC26]|uniref:radical SAM protein n=1 Tax=Nocardioides sp. R-C-SC26 TaxID=2870414 RepID=UPI0027E04E94|nr:radical SAM protein [Nocardioides sp. R-C-SC26]
MPSTFPPGDAAPLDGSLPAEALAEVGDRTFSFYLHVPFCAVRCGYCDFNTYTADELGPGVSRASFAATAAREVRLARGVLGDVELPVSTVFVGGGTPTLLPSADLGALLCAVRTEVRARR